MAPLAEVDSGKAEPYTKFKEYALKVDPDRGYKAMEIKICSFGRPHMRAFHCAWWGFFIAFFIWFSIAPLLPEVKITLNLTKQEVWTSSICAVFGTVFMRFLVGPICDKYGARFPMGIMLIAASIPTACTGFVNDATSLAVLRFFIGTAGCTFVMCQTWAARMFVNEIVGTANAIVAGWGNLGGGVTQLVMGSALFPLFKVIFKNREYPAEAAWRTVCVVPSIVAFLSGVWIIKYSDDLPIGNYSKLKKTGQLTEVSGTASFRQGALNLNTWLMFLQYACCFGVELTMNNAAALYFVKEFGQSTESAAAIASIFGWMNLFARGVGGGISDWCNKKYGMRGRLWWQTICLVAEGVLVIIFANTPKLGAAIAVMVFFSLFVQACEGSSYGIVPYIDPPVTGSISGIIGAGGNTGAVCFGFAFRQLDYKKAFIVMGITIISTAVLSFFIFIPGQNGLICGTESEEAKIIRGAIEVPTPDPESTAEVNS